MRGDINKVVRKLPDLTSTDGIAYCKATKNIVKISFCSCPRLVWADSFTLY